MNRYEHEDEDKKKYDEMRLVFDLKNWQTEEDPEIKKMKDALSEVGVHLFIPESGDRLYLSLMPEAYGRTRHRNAGRRKKTAWNQEEYEKGNFTLYRYSDIVFMMQTMKDTEIAEKIGMPIATFYRHKKELKNSEYFKSLDLNKLRDLEYLKSVKHDMAF